MADGISEVCLRLICTILVTKSRAVYRTDLAANHLALDARATNTAMELHMGEIRRRARRTRQKSRPVKTYAQSKGVVRLRMFSYSASMLTEQRQYVRRNGHISDPPISKLSYWRH